MVEKSWFSLDFLDVLAFVAAIDVNAETLDQLATFLTSFEQVADRINGVTFPIRDGLDFGD